MSLDWHRLKAVVIESDDWGLSAWAPDDQAARVLADTPVWRSTAGKHYGRSTLESADDVRTLARELLEIRGGDGFPPVLQANTIMAAPDYARLEPPQFEVEELPLVTFPATPSRWSRPGLWDAIAEAIALGVWWPELHGLHHLPAAAWLAALRRGISDARRAHEQQSCVCEAVQASSEYDPSEPLELRHRNLAAAFDRFEHLFGRAPLSMCAPDYRWDDALERDAEARGLLNFQGHGEREGRTAPRLQRFFRRMRFPDWNGRRFYLPPRIAFEPRGHAAPPGPAGRDAALRGASDAWGRGQPAVVSTHRANYAHLDPEWSTNGRSALVDLVSRLSALGATFLVDAEVRALAEHGWSTRPIGDRAVLVRYHAAPRTPIRIPAPSGVTGVVLGEIVAVAHAELSFADGAAEVRLDPGEYLLEWRRD